MRSICHSIRQKARNLERDAGDLGGENQSAALLEKPLESSFFQQAQGVNMQIDSYQGRQRFFFSYDSHWHVIDLLPSVMIERGYGIWFSFLVFCVLIRTWQSERR